MKRYAIVSVPHSGTNALAKHLGIRHKRIPPSAATPETEVVIGHIWGFYAKPGSNFAEDWLSLLEGRQAYMPVRDPEQMARSWPIVHGRSVELLRKALAEACRLLERADITRVDIRDIKPLNVRGDGSRDAETGAALVRDYPQYFGDFYGR